MEIYSRHGDILDRRTLTWDMPFCRLMRPPRSHCTLGLLHDKLSHSKRSSRCFAPTRTCISVSLEASSSPQSRTSLDYIQVPGYLAEQHQTSNSFIDFMQSLQACVEFKAFDPSTGKVACFTYHGSVSSVVFLVWIMGSIHSQQPFNLNTRSLLQVAGQMESCEALDMGMGGGAGR